MQRECQPKNSIQRKKTVEESVQKDCWKKAADKREREVEKKKVMKKWEKTEGLLIASANWKMTGNR